YFPVLPALRNNPAEPEEATTGRARRDPSRRALPVRRASSLLVLRAAESCRCWSPSLLVPVAAGPRRCWASSLLLLGAAGSRCGWSSAPRDPPLRGLVLTGPTAPLLFRYDLPSVRPARSRVRPDPAHGPGDGGRRRQGGRLGGRPRGARGARLPREPGGGLFGRLDRRGPGHGRDPGRHDRRDPAGDRLPALRGRSLVDPSADRQGTVHPVAQRDPSRQVSDRVARGAAGFPRRKIGRAHVCGLALP